VLLYQVVTVFVFKPAKCSFMFISKALQFRSLLSGNVLQVTTMSLSQSALTVSLTT